MSVATRVTFGETVTRLADDNPEIVVLDADLRKSTMTDEFSRKHPERFFDVGIAEGNMVGVGAGMALAGKIPFICSFACFVVGRFEQIRMAVAYNRANVKIVGTHAGIGIGEDGVGVGVQLAKGGVAGSDLVPAFAERRRVHVHVGINDHGFTLPRGNGVQQAKAGHPP